MTRSDIPEALRLHRHGLTLEEIGDRYGVSGQRVWQLLHDDPAYEPRRRGPRRVR